MTNAELITRVRSIAKHGADWRINWVLNRAADLIESQAKQIAELERTLPIVETVKEDALMQRIMELEAQLPKEGEWKKILQNGDGTSDYECSACHGIIMDVPDDDEHPLCSFCPNCGARMKGEQE